jgi:D-alanyl-lipoteichoic acid acyltransferase DltB (MBOAT superfamily)
VFLLYWFVFDRFISKSKHQLRLQNAFIVVASYVFYGWWDWRFLLLIAFTSLCSWGSGILIGKAKTKKKAKTWMWFNIVLNLGILATFKYYDFFVTEFAQLFHISTEGLLLKVILPVGISFYTFQALSYSIDVYRSKIEPTKDIVAFFAFISFFPQLVAGPIERATNLLPQFLKKREFNYDSAVDGMRQILWGLFKKIVVADNCAVYVDQVFSNYTNESGSTLLLAAIFFAFQLYCDFSGYSEIAIGTAKLFGVRLMRNFNNPYFATSFADYWKRNHISLTTWFMDYVYYPLIGNSDKLWYWNLCMIITFLLSGMWHGAGWTFLLWGLYQGVFIVISMNVSKSRKKFEKKHGLKNNGIWEVFTMGVTFMIVCVGLILFRAESIGVAWEYVKGICNGSLLSVPWLINRHYYIPVLCSIIILVITEWIQRDCKHGLSIESYNVVIRWLLYGLIVLLIVFEGGMPGPFVYFQF